MFLKTGEEYPDGAQVKISTNNKDQLLNLKTIDKDSVAYAVLGNLKGQTGKIFY